MPTRRVDLEPTFEDVPRHFARDGDLILSHLAAALSAVFPDGEDFFVRSVRRFRDRVDDPGLRRQVAGFIGQEAVHGREHRAFNDRLDALGYPAKRIERIVRRSIAVRERLLSAESNLAATAALEHFTATLAELLLEDAGARDCLGEPAVRDLFTWHALEECEHKAVAFDVYRAIGGSERTRVVTMRIIRVAFLIGTTLSVLAGLATDRRAYRAGVLRSSWRNFRRTPFAQREMWTRLCDYDRPDFHPDDSDTSALVSEWRRTLFGPSGRLVDRLPGGSGRELEAAG